MAFIHVERFNSVNLGIHHPCSGTFGVMTLPSGHKLFTVERPWAGNKPFVSCIPTGSYELKLRISPTVKRTSRQKHKRGWEICDVPGRTYIMVHPSDTPDDLQGCIALGLNYGIVGGRLGLHHIHRAFDIFMKELSNEESHEIHIYDRVTQYP